MDFIFIVAVVSTIIFAIKFILLLVGIGGDMDISTEGMDVEVSGEFSGLDDFLVISLDSILAAIMVFSWSNYFFIKSFGVIIGAIISVVITVVVMYLYNKVYKALRGIETKEIKNKYPSIGDVGNVYFNKKNGANVKFVIDGKELYYDVVCESSLSSGNEVIVLSENKGIVTVKKVEN